MAQFLAPKGDHTDQVDELTQQERGCIKVQHKMIKREKSGNRHREAKGDCIGHTAF